MHVTSPDITHYWTARVAESHAGRDSCPAYRFRRLSSDEVRAAINRKLQLRRVIREGVPRCIGLAGASPSRKSKTYSLPPTFGTAPATRRQCKLLKTAHRGKYHDSNRSIRRFTTAWFRNLFWRVLERKCKFRGSGIYAARPVQLFGQIIR
jgi:hypothetical protein